MTCPTRPCRRRARTHAPDGRRYGPLARLSSALAKIDRSKGSLVYCHIGSHTLRASSIIYASKRTVNERLSWMP